MPKIEGLYRHYKGQNYRVRGLAKHSETLENFIVYDAEYANPLAKTWIRPESLFFGKIRLTHGEEVERFSHIDDTEIASDEENVQIVRYNPQWIHHFSYARTKILEALGSSYNIEHIGSTSIPGLAAKDLIDMQLGVEDFETDQKIISQLQAIGLKYSPSFLQDHIPSRPTEELSSKWEKRFCSGAIDGIKINLHIRKICNPNWDYAIVFRDYLRARPEIAAAYSQLKERLSKLKISRREYAHIKDPAVDLIYWQALEWRNSRIFAQTSTEQAH